MIESVKYTLESKVDMYEREIDRIENRLQDLDTETMGLRVDREELIKQVEEHKRALLNLCSKED
ncbi:hypothetical protein CJ191_01295 [Aerococcus viridans]|uniref:Uncharacterized protein n=1 Tax=Aerococcus viridans TaxID=1377 RepID=A0A2N6UFR7_9LACT|nr:hypothetical protein [Aerococcus viridans]PMC80471.1 hypothetical protein CJ191_01295 [Aerococcus viridans]